MSCCPRSSAGTATRTSCTTPGRATISPTTCRPSWASPRCPSAYPPYASHSFWFGLPYYVGLEDDYDSGLKLLYSQGDFSLDAAFYKNAEWGANGTPYRYSYDVYNQDAGETDSFPQHANEESNQLNLQARYKLDHTGGSTELGVSGQYGELYNTITEDTGDHWAAAAHPNIFLGRWNLMLEAGRYAYNPENPAGQRDDVVHMGAYADDFAVAAESDFVVANLAYGLRWTGDRCPISPSTRTTAG